MQAYFSSLGGVVSSQQHNVMSAVDTVLGFAAHVIAGVRGATNLAGDPTAVNSGTAGGRGGPLVTQ